MPSLRVCFLIVVSSLACRAGEVRESVTVADSAGVEVVTNRAGIWAEGDQWRVRSEPDLTIGTFEGDPVYELYQVQHARRLGNGTIVVLNSGTKELRFYDELGKHSSSVGREGEGPGEFQAPGRLFVTANDTMMVWDFRLKRMSVFDRSGVFVRSFSLGSAPGSHSANVVFENRTLLVTTGTMFTPASEGGAQRDTISYILYDLDGDSIASLGTFPGQDRFVRTANRSVSVSTMIFGRSTFRAARGSSLYVAQNNGYVIDEYEPDGRFIRSIRRDVAPTVVTDDMVASEVAFRMERMPESMRSSMASLFDEMPKPETLPYYSAVLTDPEGFLWVETFRTLASPKFEWTVFDSRGRMLGQVAFPDDLTVYEIGSDYVLGRWQDESEVEHIRMHRLDRN